MLKKYQLKEIVEYNTLDLIEDLRLEITKCAEELAIVFPDRINRFSDRDLSRLWRGNNYNYIYQVKAKVENINAEFKFPDNNRGLKLLEERLIDRLGVKSLGCLRLINEYREGRFDTLSFIGLLEKELGRVSGEVLLTIEEVGLILGGSQSYIKHIFDIMINPRSSRWYDPDYKFSHERLDEFKATLREILMHRAKKSLEYINKFEKKNPDIKDYPLQAYTISNPTAFKSIDNPVTAYWFGFLCADGWLDRTTSNRIGIELSVKDKGQLVKFAKFVGLDIDRIKERIRIFEYNGKLKAYKTVYLKFNCQPLSNDLIRHRFDSFKSANIGLPDIIFSKITQAKQSASKLRINWYNTREGKVVLAWLLGFYDGDGHYKGSRSAVIYNSNKRLLEQIKTIFDIDSIVREDKPPEEEYQVFGRVTRLKGIYSLHLGPDLFDAMMSSYSASLLRKRPSSITPSDFLGNY